ncbi:MAG: SH3 domain-containing protein [Chloroflexi bacterium]|nr:SH3 domain-containing protein [Chloroflexota bacterium]
MVYYEIPTRFRFRAQAGDDIVISQTQDGGSELVYLAILDSGSNELWGQRAEGDSIANFCCIERDGTYIFEYFVFFGGSQLRLTRGPSSGEADQTCSLPPKLQPGIRAQNIDGSDTRMRGGPSLSHPRVGSIAPGDVVAVLNGPILADGYNWWQVRHGDDIGWAAEGGNCEYWLTPLSDVTDNCTLSPNLKAGGWGQVVPGPANRMRRGPSLSDPRVGSIEAGEVVAVLDGPVFVDGYYWWQVRHGDVTGWTAESGECEYWIVPVGNGSDGVGYLDNNNFFDDHKFYAREGDRVTITMSTISGDLGPALRLYNSAGQELAFDDDGGSGVNARLSDFRIPADGEYTIHALRLREGQAGGYELRLSWSQAAPDPTIQADSGDSDGFGYMATGRLNDDNFFDDYKFDARAGDDVMISMDVTSGDLNPAIRLYNSAGQELAFDDDSGSGVNARLSDFRIPADGEYTIHALRLYAGQSGEYELRLSGSRPPVTEAQESVPAGPIIVDGSCTLADAIIAANEDRAVGGCPVGSGADTITLTADITLKSELPPITSEITLEGGRNAISGGGIYQIFFVEEGGSLTIRKSRLINGGGNPEFQPEGFKFHSTFGGAIFSYGDLNIIDSEVSGNTAEHGGALFAFAGNLNIINSEFNSNAAERAGGAIRVWESQAAITNSLFSGNTAGWAGGAIDLLTDPATLTISNSEFVSNSAGAFGGAIESFSAVLRVKHSKFIGNSANTSGGAINRSYSTNVSVEGSTFSKNRPQDCVNVECVSVPDGGRTLAATAIEEGSPPPAAVPEGPINAGELCELADAITAANEDRVAGGCPAGSGHDTITLLRNISLSNALPPITTGISIDGAGKTISGAGAHRIFSVQQGGDLSISQLWLIDGSAEEGGAILNQRGNLTVTGSHFSGNTATSNDGGAIDSDGGSLSITNSTFSGNTSADDGGAIYFDNDDDNPLTLSRNTFTNNSGEDGGALYFDDGFGDLENNTFRGNSAGDNGGAIYFDDDDGGPLSISGNTFAENSAEDEGGAIYVRDGQGTLSDNKFEDNTPNRCAGRGLPNFSGGCGDAPEDMPEVRTWRVGARALIVHDDTDLWRDAGPLGGRNVVKRKLDAGTPIEFLDLNDPHDSHAWYLVRVLETDLIEGWIAQPIDGPDLFIESTVTISVPAVAPKDTEAEAESSTPSIALGESVEFCLVAETDRDSFQLLLTEPSFFIAVSMTAHDQNTEIMVPALTLWDSAGNELKTDKNDSEERVAQLNVSNPQPGLYTVSAWTVRGKGCYTLAAFDGGTELEVVTEGSGVSYERLKHADGNVDLSAIDDQELVAIGVIDAARFHGSGFEDGVNVCFPGFGEVMFRSEFNPATYHPWPSLRNNGKTCTRILRPGTLALVTDSDDLSALYTPLQPYYAGIADVPNLFLQLADSTLFRGAFLHCQPAVDRFKLDRLRFRSGLIESEEFVGSTTDHIARCVTGDAMGAGPNDLRESVDTLNDFLVGVEKLDAVNDFIQKHPKDATADSTLFAMFERGLITEEEYLTYLVYREEGESFVAFSLRDHLVTILETGIDALPLTDAAKQYARNSVDTLLASEEADEILENTERVINHPLFPLVISRSVTGEVRSTPKAWNDLFVVALMEVAGEDSIDAVADLLVWVPMGPGETLYLILGEGAQQYAYTRGKLKDYCRITNKARATLHVRAAPDLNSEALGALVIDRRIFSEGIVTDANEKRWHKVLVRQSPHKRGATGLASLRGSGSSSIQWLDGYIDADWVEEKGVCDDYVEPDAG